MRLLVCGGRDYQDRQAVYDELTRINPDLILHGGCPTGADRFAQDWASKVARTVGTVVYHADWSQHGRAAGPIRNQQMIDDGKPDMVLAFPGGRGTADMVRRTKKAGVPLIQWGAHNSGDGQ